MTVTEIQFMARLGSTVSFRSSLGYIRSKSQGLKQEKEREKNDSEEENGQERREVIASGQPLKAF